MRFRVGQLVERLLLLGAPAVGALIATGDVGSGPVGPATRAACTSALPGTGARCDTDRVVASISTYGMPTLTGLAVGFAVAVAVVFVLRISGRMVQARPPGTAEPAPPAWIVARPGTPVAPVARGDERPGQPGARASVRPMRR